MRSHLSRPRPPAPTVIDAVDGRDHDHDDDHHRGLTFDLQTLVARRHALKLLGGAGVLALAGCGVTGETTSTASSTTTARAAGATATSGASTSTSGAGTGTSTTAGAANAASSVEAADAVIPSETAGPYPGDGSNGPNVLTESGIVRRDIRSSIGASSGTAEGVPLTVTLHLADIGNGGAPLAGAAVYLWHCDRDGGYSMYSRGVTDQNYLRGVQESDADGDLTFVTIFPAAYAGRWPHIHFEVYPNLAEATAAGTPTTTSQLALPADVCDAVYATAGYEQSVRNLAQTSLTADNVFGDDGGVHQLATVTGSVADGYVATLAVGV